MKEKGIEKIFQAGSTIIRQNEPGNRIYIIESGMVEVSLALKSGEIIPITRFGKGELFGELSLYNKKLRTATVTAVTDVKVIVLKKKRITGLIDKMPVWFQIMIKRLLERIKYSNLAIIKQAEAKNELFEKERLQALMELAGAAAHEINQPLTTLVLSCELLQEDISRKKIKKHTKQILDATMQISKIVKQMRVIKKYVTKPYVGKVKILDLENSSKKT